MKVIQILNGGGTRTASHAKVENVSKNVVKLFDSEIRFHAHSGIEINPAISGFYMEIVPLEDQDL
jgi:hypothetical protein